MSRAIASAAVVLSFFASLAGAQVFYMPVQYQYSSGGRSYYYGGADPMIHAQAQRQSIHSGWGRTQGWAFHSARMETHREVACEPTRIYSDAVPTQNARFFGYTVDDARNDAYNNASTYFRKANLAREAVGTEDGTWVVPSQPLPRGSIEIRPYRASEKAPLPEAKPAVEPRPILIIPKHLLDKPLWPQEGNPVASR